MITRLTAGFALSFGLLAAWPAHSNPVACVTYFATIAHLDIHVERRADQPPALQPVIDAYLRTLISGEPAPVMTAQVDAIARTWSWLVTVEPGVAPEARPAPIARRSRWDAFRARLPWWSAADESSRALAPPAPDRSNFVTGAQALSLAELHDWQATWWRALASGNSESQLSALTLGWRALEREAARIEAVLPQPVRGSVDEHFLARFMGSDFGRRIDSLISAVPNLIILPDSESYSRRDLNDLSPFPVYLVGFVNLTTRADNRNWWPLGYPYHDLIHARSAYQGSFRFAIEKLQNGSWTHARFMRYVAARARVYGAFRRMVERQGSEATRTALDLVWHHIYHEQSRQHEMSGRGLSRAIHDTDYDAPFPVRTLEGRIRERLSSGFYGSDPDIQRLGHQDVRKALELLLAFAETQEESNADASLSN